MSVDRVAEIIMIRRNAVSTESLRGRKLHPVLLTLLQGADRASSPS